VAEGLSGEIEATVREVSMSKLWGRMGVGTDSAIRDPRWQCASSP
jgi:hypothetical protein